MHNSTPMSFKLQYIYQSMAIWVLRNTHVDEICKNVIKTLFAACSAPSHHLHQCWLTMRMGHVRTNFNKISFKIQHHWWYWTLKCLLHIVSHLVSVSNMSTYIFTLYPLLSCRASAIGVRFANVIYNCLMPDGTRCSQIQGLYSLTTRAREGSKP